MRSSSFFDRAEHHRRRRRHSELLGFAHHADPRIGDDLARADPLADALDQNLGAGTGKRFHPGGLEAHQDLARRQFFDLREPGDLRDRERVDVDVGVFARDAPEELFEPGQPQLRVDAAWIMICVAP